MKTVVGNTRVSLNNLVNTAIPERRANVWQSEIEIFDFDSQLLLIFFPENDTFSTAFPPLWQISLANLLLSFAMKSYVLINKKDILPHKTLVAIPTLFAPLQTFLDFCKHWSLFGPLLHPCKFFSIFVNHHFLDFVIFPKKHD